MRECGGAKTLGRNESEYFTLLVAAFSGFSNNRPRSSVRGLSPSVPVRTRKVVNYA